MNIRRLFARMFTAKPKLQLCWCLHPVVEHDRVGCTDHDCPCLASEWMNAALDPSLDVGAQERRLGPTSNSKQDKVSSI